MSYLVKISIISKSSEISRSEVWKKSRKFGEDNSSQQQDIPCGKEKKLLSIQGICKKTQWKKSHKVFTKHNKLM